MRRNRDRTTVADHGIAVARLQLAVDTDLQIAGSRIGLDAIRTLYGNEARALHRDIERTTGLLNHPRRQVGADGGTDNEGAGVQSISDQRNCTKRTEFRAETRGIGIGQIVRHHRLLFEQVFGAGHGCIYESVHDLETRDGGLGFSEG